MTRETGKQKHYTVSRLNVNYYLQLQFMQWNISRVQLILKNNLKTGDYPIDDYLLFVGNCSINLSNTLLN